MNTKNPFICTHILHKWFQKYQKDITSRIEGDACIAYGEEGDTFMSIYWKEANLFGKAIRVSSRGKV